VDYDKDAERDYLSEDRKDKEEEMSIFNVGDWDRDKDEEFAVPEYYQQEVREGQGGEERSNDWLSKSPPHHQGPPSLILRSSFAPPALVLQLTTSPLPSLHPAFLPPERPPISPTNPGGLRVHPLPPRLWEQERIPGDPGRSGEGRFRPPP